MNLIKINSKRRKSIANNAAHSKYIAKRGIDDYRLVRKYR